MFRYFIYIREATIGCIYHPKLNQLRVFGNQRFISQMESYIWEYVGKPVPKAKQDRNKVRYWVNNVSKKRFTDSKLLMEEHGFIFQQVTSLGRIGR